MYTHTSSLIRSNLHPRGLRNASPEHAPPALGRPPQRTTAPFWHQAYVSGTGAGSEDGARSSSRTSPGGSNAAKSALLDGALLRLQGCTAGPEAAALLWSPEGRRAQAGGRPGPSVARSAAAGTRRLGVLPLPFLNRYMEKERGSAPAT